jgi:hypothetical protein
MPTRLLPSNWCSASPRRSLFVLPTACRKHALATDTVGIPRHRYSPVEQTTDNCAASRLSSRQLLVLARYVETCRQKRVVAFSLSLAGCTPLEKQIGFLHFPSGTASWASTAGQSQWRVR